MRGVCPRSPASRDQDQHRGRSAGSSRSHEVRACLEKPSYDDPKQRCPLKKPSYDDLKQRCPLEKPSYDHLKQRCPLEKPSYDHLKQGCPLEKPSYDDLKQRCPLAVKPRARMARYAWDDGMGPWERWGQTWARHRYLDIFVILQYRELSIYQCLVRMALV